MREPAPIVRGAGPRTFGHAHAARRATLGGRELAAQRAPERWTPHAGKSSTVRNDARSIPRCSAGSTESALVEDRVRWVGDYVAFVVAETVHQAADAAELIAVEYERCRR